MRFPTFLLSVALVAMCVAGFAPESEASDEGPVRLVGTIKHPLINEMSGLARSRRFDDLYWAHNDSGDEPRLFALTGDGDVIFPPWLAREFKATGAESDPALWPGHRVDVAANIDWEDIAVDGENIYIADMGNNGNARRDLGIYVVREPNPRAVEHTRPMKFIPVAYPEQANFPARQWHFDSEALFVSDGTLFVLTKHRQPGKISAWEPGTNLYRLDSMATDRVNLLKRIDTHPAVAVVTAAELSPDGVHLAVLGYRDLWVFERPRRKDHWLSGRAFRLGLEFEQTGQIEALTWRDNDTLLIGNEGDRQWFEVERKDIPAFN